MTDHGNLKYGERRNATVLFSDMQGFSALSERLDPEEVDGLMDRVFATFERIIRRHGGNVEKYIGDALVAVFGAPEVHEDDAARAVHAALEFRAELRRLRINASFRTGIHTGLVTTGKRGSFDVVTGHAMTIASRLQAAAPEDTVLVSEETIAECGDYFILRERREIPIRGTGEHVTAFIIGGRRIGLHEYHTPFIGRVRLISSLLKKYMAHDGAEMDGICVRGPAGVGKTRLIAELIGKLGEIPGCDVQVLYSRARKFRSLPFAAVNDLVLGRFGIASYDSEERIGEALRKGLEVSPESEETQGNSAQPIPDYARFVTRGADMPEGEAFVTIHRIFEAMLASAADSVHPPIVFVDNFHLTDRESVDFLRYYVERATIFPFFILAGRPEAQASERVFPELEPVEVGPLETSETRAMIDSIWPERSSDEPAQQIVMSSGGIPLFVEEYVRYVREHPAEAGDPDAGLPPTIQTILLASIESYRDELQELLKKLSVFERSFTLEDARTIHERTDGNPEEVGPALDAFVSHGHLMSESGVYHFRQELFKRTLYESLLNYNKRVLHGIVVDWIREHEPEIIRANQLLLLHHLAKSERIEELREAFFADVRHIHNPDFLPFIECLIEHTDEDDPDYFKYLFTKYAILFNSRNAEGTEEILQTLIRTCVAQKRPEYAARVYQVLCAESLMSHDFATAADYGYRAVHYFNLVDPEHRSLPNTYENLASALLFEGRLDENRSVIDRIVDTGNRYDSHTAALVKRHLHLAEYHEATKLLESRLEESDPGETEFWYGAYYMLCLILQQMHDYPRLESVTRLLLQAVNQSNSYYAEAYAMLSMSLRRRYAAEVESEAIGQAEYYLRRIPNDASRMQPCHTVALAHAFVGDFDRARVTAEEALRIAMRIGARRIHFPAAVLLSELAYLRNSPDELGFYLDEAARGVAEFPYLNRQDLALYYYLQSETTSGPDGRRHLERARTLIDEECRALASPDLCGWFLGTRSFGSIDPERESGRRAG